MAARLRRLTTTVPLLPFRLERSCACTPAMHHHTMHYNTRHYHISFAEIRTVRYCHALRRVGSFGSEWEGGGEAFFCGR